jgi:hypothetical protein
MGIAHLSSPSTASASNILPRALQDVSHLIDPSRPAWARPCATSSLAPLLILRQNHHLCATCSRLDSPGPRPGQVGAILQELCNCKATVRRFGDITHQPAPLQEKHCPGGRVLRCVPPASSNSSLKDGCNICRVACSKVVWCGTRHQSGEWQEIALTLARALPSFHDMSPARFWLLLDEQASPAAR